ncbi:MAG: exodeoxyribonuclease VII large subunit [Oligoflexales bacterium]
MQLTYKHNERYVAVFGDADGEQSILRDSWLSLGGQYIVEKSCWVMPYTADVLGKVDLLCADSNQAALAQQGHVSKQTHDTNSSMSVKEVLDRIHGVVDTAFPAPVWVTGEIQNFSKRGASCYLSLAEKGRSDGATLTIQTTLWPRSWKFLVSKYGSESLQALLQDGLNVRFLCQVSLYKVRGQVSLSVVDVDPSWTQGALALAREQLLKDLRRRGMDRLNKNQPMPFFPFHVGLITASSSRAESDFLHQLMDAKFPGRVSFISCPMQGEKVDIHLPLAIKSLQHCDVIVMTRGGGSAADLRWFDTKSVAEAIALSQKPIIAAIGHHDDRSVAEDIAHLRVKTPTAAAEVLVQKFRDVSAKLQTVVTQFAKILSWRAQGVETELAYMETSLATQARENLKTRNYRLDQAVQLMESLSQSYLTQKTYRLEVSFSYLMEQARLSCSGFDRSIESQAYKLGHGVSYLLSHLDKIHLEYEKSLAKHDPTPWLEQGWTRLYQNHRVVRHIEDVTDETLMVRLVDGRLKLQTIEKEKI